jgi:hypothetical protein
MCVGANYTEAWDGAWGWSDAQCFRKYPALCMKAGEWRWQQLRNLAGL